MAYEPPNGKKVNFNFTGSVYTPPNGKRIRFNFTDDDNPPIGDTQFIFPTTWNSFTSGIAFLRLQYRYVVVEGLYSSSFGTATLYNKTQNIDALGFNATAFSLSNVINRNKEIKTIGFNSQIFGTPSKVYNLKQIVNLNARGIGSAEYGVAYFQGGVKYVGATGFNSAILPNPIVINNKADQYANLNNRGINPPTIPNPNVSPRIIYPSGILAWRFGTPLVQRSPSPKGFDTSFYGVAWVSHSPRYIQPAQVEAYLSGFPKIFDPTQTIYFADRGFSGGIFGDIAIRNTRRVLDAKGFDAYSPGDWSIVESNLRNIIHQGFNALSFGSSTIHNKTPSIAPTGFDALHGLETVIGYRIRTVKPSGFYQPKFGTHKFTKPPEIKPAGINQSDLGVVFISNYTRLIYAGVGKDTSSFGEHDAWFRYRNIQPDGFNVSRYGTLRIEHGRRELLVKGAVHSAYGIQAWLSHGVRTLLADSIAAPNIPIHRVGGTQYVQPIGYIATFFGSRIIPESQSVYPQGFVNPFGLAIVDLFKKHILPKGLLTTGQEGGHRFGWPKFWNLKQYIFLFYDGDSGLVPPVWSGWTSIQNRNKTIGTVGNNFTRIAEPQIENKARPLLPIGLNTQAFGQLMIADRVRYLKLQGMESPYFSGWSAIYNAAPVIVLKGINTQAFGHGSIVNTRRYFNRIGNFESLEMGVAMISDRIRVLTFERRYTIAPPIIPLPTVDLYTRYIEEVGRSDDYLVFGLPLFSIRWNRITTRWTHRDYFGMPHLQNVTPEVKQRGRNSEEFGNVYLRTQWRELVQQGSETVLWGKSSIAFKDRQFSVPSFTQWNIPRPKVIKTGVPPYYPQYIWLDSVDIDGESHDGHGIEMPRAQVPNPLVKTNVVFVSGFSATRYGEQHHAQSNGIMIESGIPMPIFDNNPVVILKNRVINVDSGISSTVGLGKPRLTPHTIYAVMEAPPQAVANHGGNSHFVNSGSGTRHPGEVFGRVNISLQHRVTHNISSGHNSEYGTPTIQLKRRFIEVRGIQSYRMGWHAVGDGTQFITQRTSSLMSVYGIARIQQREQLHRTIYPNGLNALGISSNNWVSHFHREMLIFGFNAQRMGTRLSNDKPFMWQGLRVGELVKGNYGGLVSEVFGLAWISNWIRDVAVDGFDSFICDYDHTAFDKRMKITGTEISIPIQEVQAVGFDAFTAAVPNIKPAVHYIRPDGNADQYRKGAF